MHFVSPTRVTIALLACAVTCGAADVPPRPGTTAPLTVRATRLERPLRIDGTLDESIYEEVTGLTGFVQVEPNAGQVATERTELWLAYDERNVYVAFRVWDTEMGRLVATEMRRDNGNIWSGNDVVIFVFDTFNDKRTALSFTVNALGARSDGQVFNEKQFNPDWNPVWNLKTARFEGGWTMEAALPFKSFRYAAGAEQVWGFNAARVKRSKNEISMLSPVPPSQGQQGVEQPAFAARLLGITAPPGGASLDLKPFVTSSISRDGTGARPLTSRDADIGLDARVNLSRTLAADLTVNTDFAQVEADQQQVNLTRFSLFFPEKREFFLENQGTFAFGGVPVGSLNAGTSDAPILFYSRRIGLDAGRPVPIVGGGRLTGRIGAYNIGLIDVQADDLPGTNGTAANFSVFRLKRDVLRRSSIGLIATGRTSSGGAESRNLTYGVDGTFSPVQNLQINTYWATSDTMGAARPEGYNNRSYRLQTEFTGDRYGLTAERLTIGRQFAPGAGFVRRADMFRNYLQGRFSPRAPQGGAIRKYVTQGTMDDVENGTGRLETRTRSGEFYVDFRNADKVGVLLTNSYEWLPAPFRIGPGVTLPSGAYVFTNTRVYYTLAQQRAVSANLQLDYGSFYNGHKTTVTVGRGRVPVTTRLSVEPTYSYNRVVLREGAFSTQLAGSRITFTMTPLMFVSALVQYNSSTRTMSTNARLRWEYRPGSEVFVVYNDERDTAMSRPAGALSRVLIVKVNRLFRF
ncbi:MAG: DUF5916 domain-containing protein [Vicinamibacterales bacterium]|nr:DUF5916 domain-containing protein [Vicinamibacterales bacterium]